MYNIATSNFRKLLLTMHAEEEAIFFRSNCKKCNYFGSDKVMIANVFKKHLQ